MILRSLLLLLLAAFVHAQVCCHVCLANLGPSSYDPTVFAQCDKKTPGCCFCDAQLTIAAPAFSSSQQQGTWQKVAWSGVSKVTKVNVPKGSESASHPQLTMMLSPVQQDAAGNYLFCSDTPGETLFRGWGPLANTYPSNCTALSAQLSITITAGTGKCSDASPTSTSPTTKPGGASSQAGSSSGVTKAPTVKCDANRGYVDSDNKCQCLSDYSGPPTCDGMALWKILVSVAGGLAALFSIVVSVRQFILFQRRKREEDELANAPVDQSSKNFDTMYAMPASHEYYDSVNVNATSSRHTDASRDGVRSSEDSRVRPSLPESDARFTGDADGRYKPRESKEYTL
ncbi:hypothetical protein SDRG_03231 [Saprolegnia diclina VS20]|uniref:EGF-like domain-containing protein n=1 Tax=Saprolegnia diclina (strain VS20) TaxID=1156394 RepID=T0QNW5_SAPDV|nr:hypothetical protein SDRG_03231 [Saprolegnia diclina VS20]EQC39809.1 hypothetical protein SDRG_03231 [Saprolegnia diclina VS20]|eukprot:XP_008607081.1 hypothetical protein SDRG_03231 [Saprolegnia diclina VS20]